MKQKSCLRFALAMALLLSSTSLNLIFVFAAPSYSIDLEEFRWNNFPLKVLIDMNQWSTSDYASAVRESLEAWIMSIWAYTQSGDKTLRMINYTFYMSNINTTSDYDILITFAANEQGSNVVGLTTSRWNTATHEPVPPTTINITTYSATASHLFVKNVAMHEIGHALGLGHASHQSASDGPELMYYRTSVNQVVYPSTLDLYALTELYQDNFGHQVMLPSSMLYEMVWPLTSGRITILSGINNASIVGAGVYPLGTVATLRAPDFVLLSNGTKLIFLDWNINDTHTIIPNATASIVVYGDIAIIVDWNVEYYVDIRTLFSIVNIESGYLPKGYFISLYIYDEIIDFGNGTRVIYKGFNPNNFYLSEPTICTATWERQYQKPDYTFMVILIAFFPILLIGLALSRGAKRR